MKLEITNKEIPAAIGLIEQLRPGLKLDAERELLKGVAITTKATIRKTLADGTVFELDLDIS